MMARARLEMRFRDQRLQLCAALGHAAHDGGDVALLLLAGCLGIDLVLSRQTFIVGLIEAGLQNGVHGFSAALDGIDQMDGDFSCV